MASFVRIGSALLLGAAVVQGQSSSATATSLAPARQTVSASSSLSAASLSEAETVQLTTQTLESLTRQLNASIVSLFDFGNGTTSNTRRSNSACKVYPDDPEWPVDGVWDILDLLLGGSLIKTTPSASSCYPGWGDESASECSYVTSEWNISYFHMDDPTSIMWPLFEGRTCLPPGFNVTDTCTKGGYPEYAVNVSTVAEIQLAINFARNLDLRLVVKNTGHDFSGKSAGYGALSIWTHHLKSLEYLPDYQDSIYSGPAVKMGAGIQAFEIYEFANANNFTAVGGEGKTVGVGGGYVLGGGHSPLSSIYGLAADQVLALEVVLPDGTFTTVTEESNPDLFWGLRGGGGSTFGVVTSIINKVYPKIGVTVAKFTFSTSDTVSADTFFEALGIYYSYFEEFTAAGTYVYFWVLALGDDQYEFEFNPFFAVNHTLDQFNTLIQPLVDDLSAIGVSITPDGTYYDNFYDGWQDGFPLETVGTVVQLTGSRLFPYENFVNETLRNETLAAHRATLEAGFPILAFQMKAEYPEGTVENAANPAFRKMRMHGITSANWDANATDSEIIAAINELTYGTLAPWRATCPESGAYMSEADVLEPNFQQAFYGTNYDRLYALKEQYDPLSVFWAPTAVGSENWTFTSVDGIPDQNGRLCRRLE